MAVRFLTRNNVKTTLVDPITPTDTQFRLFNASSPFRNPPSPTVNTRVRLTIVDSATPSKIEIIECDQITIDGSDYRLLRVTDNDPAQGRGLEGTTGQSFSAGAIVYLANTSGMIDAKANVVDVIIVDREVVTIGGDSYLQVTAEEGSSGEILFYSYKLA